MFFNIDVAKSVKFDYFRFFHLFLLRMVPILFPGLIRVSLSRLHSRFCSFLWHWSTMHQIFPTARAISSITARASSMIHQTIKGMIRDGPLRTRGDMPANFNSYKKGSESQTP